MEIPPQIHALIMGMGQIQNQHWFGMLPDHQKNIMFSVINALNSVENNEITPELMEHIRSGNEIVYQMIANRENDDTLLSIFRLFQEVL